MLVESPESRDIGRFIRSRREGTDADQFPELPRRRRHAQHLTQGDLAELVGITTVVISQIEQGRYPNLNTAMLQRISQALGLTQQHEIYLQGLLAPRHTAQKTSGRATEWVARSVMMVEHAAVVVDPTFELLCVNTKARALLSDQSDYLFASGNGVVSIFQEPRMRELIVDWPAYAASVVSGLKMSFAMFPDYRQKIEAMAGSLEASDDTFREYWRKDDPLVKPTLEKQLRHAIHGPMLVFQVHTDFVEASTLTKIEFLAVDDETAKKMRRME